MRLLIRELKDFFYIGIPEQKIAAAAAAAAADRLIEYTVGLVLRTDLIRPQLDRIDAAKALAPVEKAKEYVKAYFELEKFIVQHEPLIVKRKFTQEELRKDIREKLGTLGVSFDLLLAEDIEQATRLCEIMSESILHQTTTMLGQAASQRFMDRAGVAGFRSTEFKNPEHVISSFQKLLSELYLVISNTVGVEKATSIFEVNYKKLEEEYAILPYTIEMLKVLPVGVFEEEKIKTLSRAELEEKVRERTKELEEKVKERTKELEHARNNLEEKVKERTAEMEEAKAYSEGILESVKDFLWVVDLNGNILSVNKAFDDYCAHQGFDINQYIGKPAFELPFIPSEDISKYMHMMKEDMEKGHAGPLEISYVTKDGNIIYQSVIASVVKNPQGKPVALLSVFRDITKSKKLVSELSDFREATIYMLADLDKTSKDLAESKEYIHGIINNAIDTIIVVGPDGKIKTTNPAAAQLLGYKEDELIGKPVATIFEEEEEEEEDSLFKGARLQKLIEEGSIRDYDMTYKTRSGEKIPVSFSGSVMRDKDGNLVGVVGIARDMRGIIDLMEKEKEFAAAAAAADADRKKAGELEKAYDELRGAQEKLVQSEKLASVGRLAAGVAHEINNPLASIMLGAQRMSAKIKKEARGIGNRQVYMTTLERIEKSTNRCKRIVAGLLAFSRPTQLELGLIDINEVIKETLESLEDKVNDGDVKVVQDFAADLPVIKADGQQLSQVFDNLITNACEAMPKGGRLRIITKLQEPGIGTEAPRDAMGQVGNTVEIEFSDTGGGISDEDMLRIFDPFFTTKETGKGVGLGLSISYGIIEEHGGAIEVRSEKGEGTTFIVKLPVDPEVEQSTLQGRQI